jgi:hypothetical protein
MYVVLSGKAIYCGKPDNPATERRYHQPTRLRCSNPRPPAPLLMAGILFAIPSLALEDNGCPTGAPPGGLDAIGPLPSLPPSGAGWPF